MHYEKGGSNISITGLKKFSEVETIGRRERPFNKISVDNCSSH